MRGLRAGLAVVPLVAGAASAAEPLNDAQLDTVTAGVTVSDALNPFDLIASSAEMTLQIQNMAASILRNPLCGNLCDPLIEAATFTTNVLPMSDPKGSGGAR
jgi:hypothetical protein